MLFVISGCSGTIGTEEKYIKIQKRIGYENTYQDFKEITENEQVQKVKTILDKADWEKAKVEMSRDPDYQFIFQFKNPNTEAKAVVHMLWLNKYSLELVRGSHEYVHLNEEDSEVLLEILVGEINDK